MKAQSSIEYLMTYGWAILIIAIVMGALLTLGLFNKGNLIPSACLATSGFECENPSLTTSGTLTATLGQFTGTDWSEVTFYLLNTSATPTCPLTGAGVIAGTSSSSSLLSGGTTQVTFDAFPNAPASGIGLGIPYSGSIWAQYLTTIGGTSACIQVATISIKST